MLLGNVGIVLERDHHFPHLFLVSHRRPPKLAKYFAKLTQCPGKVKLNWCLSVSKWRRRFLNQGLAGLYEEARPGAPRAIIDEQVAALLSMRK